MQLIITRIIRAFSCVSAAHATLNIDILYADDPGCSNPQSKFS